MEINGNTVDIRSCRFIGACSLAFVKKPINGQLQEM